MPYGGTNDWGYAPELYQTFEDDCLSELDHEGEPKVDIEDDVEYDEQESLQILAWHGGRAEVRKELQHRRNDRGYGKPRDTSNSNKPQRASSEELLAKTRCY